MNISEDDIREILNVLEDTEDFIDGIAMMTSEESEQWNGTDDEEGLLARIQQAKEILEKHK